jgi:hypothetical protein
MLCSRLMLACAGLLRSTAACGDPVRWCAVARGTLQAARGPGAEPLIRGVLRLFRRERLGLKPPGMMEEGEPNERAFEAWLRDAAIIKAPEPAPAAPPPKPSGPVRGVPGPRGLLWLWCLDVTCVWPVCSLSALPPCVVVRGAVLLFWTPCH